jgi:hypothetical protein
MKTSTGWCSYAVMRIFKNTNDKIAIKSFTKKVSRQLVGQ